MSQVPARRDGARPRRDFPVAVSVEAQALAWARQEHAPEGAVVVVDHEIGPRGLHGRLWSVAASSTLACAVTLRPALPAEEGDVAWLLGGIGAADGAAAVAARRVATWWPDLVVDGTTGEPVGAIKAEIQLGPGQVHFAVVSVRLDLGSLAMEARREELLEGVLHAFDDACARLAEGAESVAARYTERCALLGRRVKIGLLPKGETRGIARSVDHWGRLELSSPTGMVEHVTIDTLGRLELA